MRTTLALTVALAMASCNGGENDVISPNSIDTHTISFSVSPYHKSDIDDEDTRAVSVDTLSQLAAMVYETDGECIKKVLQKKGTIDYGTFSFELPQGTYDIAFIGWDGTSSINVDDITNITFSGNNVPDTFLKYVQLSINNETGSNHTITLSRCVSAISFLFTDAIPKDASMIYLDIEGAGSAMNAKTGRAANTQRNVSGSISSARGETNFRVGTKVFLTSNESTINTTVRVATTTNANAYKRTFTDIPMAIGQRTTCRGSFFTPATNSILSTLNLDNVAWNEKEINY